MTWNYEDVVEFIKNDFNFDKHNQMYFSAVVKIEMKDIIFLGKKSFISGYEFQKKPLYIYFTENAIVFDYRNYHISEVHYSELADLVLDGQDMLRIFIKGVDRPIEVTYANLVKLH